MSTHVLIRVANVRAVQAIQFVYAISNIYIYIQMSSSQNFKPVQNKITEIDAQEALDWQKSSMATSVDISGHQRDSRPSGDSDCHRKC